MNANRMLQVFGGIGPHNPKYLRGLNVIGVGLTIMCVSWFTTMDHDHRVNEVLSYQRWAFSKVDAFLDISEKDLLDAGWKPKKPSPNLVGKPKLEAMRKQSELKMKLEQEKHQAKMKAITEAKTEANVK